MTLKNLKITFKDQLKSSSLSPGASRSLLFLFLSICLSNSSCPKGECPLFPHSASIFDGSHSPHLSTSSSSFGGSDSVFRRDESPRPLLKMSFLYTAHLPPVRSAVAGSCHGVGEGEGGQAPCSSCSGSSYWWLWRFFSPPSISALPCAFLQPMICE